MWELLLALFREAIGARADNRRGLDEDEDQDDEDDEDDFTHL